MFFVFITFQGSSKKVTEKVTVGFAAAMTTWNDIPDDALKEIAKLLDIEGLVTFSAIDKRTNEIVRKDEQKFFFSLYRNCVAPQIIESDSKDWKKQLTQGMHGHYKTVAPCLAA
jgi:hypothetical protein